MIHAYICPNTNCTECILLNEKDEMIGLIESSNLLYLLNKLNAVIDNPLELKNPDIIISIDGRIHKSKAISNMKNKT